MLSPVGVPLIQINGTNLTEPDEKAELDKLKCAQTSLQETQEPPNHQDFNGLVKRNLAFMKEMKNTPDFPHTISESNLEKLKQLTIEVRACLKAHIPFNFEDLKSKLQQEFEIINKNYEDCRFQIFEPLEAESILHATQNESKEDQLLNKLLKALPLSELMFDPGNIIKGMEEKLSNIKRALQEVEKIINFIKSEDSFLENSHIPLFDFNTSFVKLVRLGYVQVVLNSND